MIVSPDKVLELIEQTGCSETECIQTILQCDSHIEAILTLKQLDKTKLLEKIRVGSIVVVDNRRLSIQPYETITKVLALLKPGIKSKSSLTLEYDDNKHNLSPFTYTTNDHVKRINSIVALENLSKRNFYKYNGKRCFIEYTGALRLATAEEKKLYYKHKQGKG